MISAILASSRGETALRISFGVRSEDGIEVEARVATTRYSAEGERQTPPSSG